MEPIQGEAGIIIPPAGFLKEAAEICRANRVLLMTDEIQSGLGRTGKLFAYMHDGITPDVLIVGKALAGGFYPVSAILASKEILGVYKPGDHGSTFGGNPLGCAVARTALRVLAEERMVERSAELGAYLLAQLKALRKTLVDPAIAAHRGRIVKNTGDGMLVEFASAVDAVRLAVKIQRDIATRLRQATGYS